MDDNEDPMEIIANYLDGRMFEVKGEGADKETQRDIAFRLVRHALSGGGSYEYAMLPYAASLLEELSGSSEIMRMVEEVRKQFALHEDKHLYTRVQA